MRILDLLKGGFSIQYKIMPTLLIIITLATALPLRSEYLESEGAVGNEVALLTENEMVWGLMQIGQRQNSTSLISTRSLIWNGIKKLIFANGG
jgi:hypothetical protein